MADTPQTLDYYQTAGIDTYTNPLLADGQLIHAVNVVSFPYGAKTKRTGYSQFLNNPDGSIPWSLFDFQNIGNDAGSMNLYRASGTSLYYSLQGTGDWTAVGNGTLTSNSLGVTYFGHVALGTVLIGGDGVNPTRHTTDGTSFTNTSLAPVGQYFSEYQRRVYVGGTANTLFYSTTNDATNWSTSGTSDSSSFTIPGDGKINSVFKVADKIITSKTSGQMYKWDGYSLIDTATRYGPANNNTVASVEGYKFFLNKYGIYGFGGGQPQLLSNAIQRQFYNNNSTGIDNPSLPYVPSVAHRYDYLSSTGALTDDFTGRVINNCVIKYDYQKNEFLNWDLANLPYAFCSYQDINNAQQLIFSGADGKTYKFDNSTTDNGVAINAEMVFLFHAGSPHLEKKWNWWRGMFNPGCEAKVQVACSNVLTYQNLVWQDLGDCSSGFCEYRFPFGSRSHFLFVRIYESSKTSRFSYYGSSINFEIQRVIP